MEPEEQRSDRTDKQYVEKVCCEILEPVAGIHDCLGIARLRVNEQMVRMIQYLFIIIPDR